MKWLVILFTVIGVYAIPTYFSGDLSLPMLLESGIRSGVVISVCAALYKDLKILKAIMALELSLIGYTLITIADWESQFLGLDRVIGTLNNLIFWVEILILLIGGLYAAVSTYYHDRDIRAISKDSAKGC